MTIWNLWKRKILLWKYYKCHTTLIVFIKLNNKYTAKETHKYKNKTRLILLQSFLKSYLLWMELFLQMSHLKKYFLIGTKKN